MSKCPREPVRIKEGVFLMAARKEPRIEWSALELDENVQDDRILARMLLFKEEYPERDVRFLTNDYAALLKADDRNIPTLMPDGKVLAPRALKSTVEAELEATRKELNDYRNRAPKLEFGFDDGQKTTETVVCSTSGYNATYAEVLAQALDEDYVPKQIIEQRAEFEKILKAAKGHVSDYDVREFAEDYEAYLAKLEAARKRELMGKYGRRCELTFIIENVGTAPITDLAIELAFPAGTLVIDADDEGKEILVPKEPKASWIRNLVK
jgi:PIN domain